MLCALYELLLPYSRLSEINLLEKVQQMVTQFQVYPLLNMDPNDEEHLLDIFSVGDLFLSTVSRIQLKKDETSNNYYTIMLRSIKCMRIKHLWCRVQDKEH